jgi:hypothetical protein
MLGAEIREYPCRFCDATGQRVAPWNAKAGETRVGVCSVCRGTAVQIVIGAVPKGEFVESWIGFDASEADRINDMHFPAYQKPIYPLLDLARPAERVEADRRYGRRKVSLTGWNRGDVLWYLNQQGWGETPKSSCFICPNARNPRWRQLMADPNTREKLIEFDHAIRTAPGLRSERFLHEDRMPIDQANLTKRTPAENRRDQLDLFDPSQEIADEDYGGCSPHGCHVEPPDQIRDLIGEALPDCEPDPPRAVTTVDLPAQDVAS